MAQTEYITHPESKALFSFEEPQAPASGLFGYSLNIGTLHQPHATSGYVREIEQMPNFSPPSIENFVAHYVASISNGAKEMSDNERAIG